MTPKEQATTNITAKATQYSFNLRLNSVAGVSILRVERGMHTLCAADVRAEKRTHPNKNSEPREKMSRLPRDPQGVQSTTHGALDLVTPPISCVLKTCKRAAPYKILVSVHW